MSDITAGEALDRLTDSLNATNVLSSDYKRHITAWAYKAVSRAHAEGREQGRAAKPREKQSGRTLYITDKQMEAIGACASIAGRLSRSYDVYGGVDIAEALKHIDEIDGAWWEAGRDA